jgi:ABC-2 type transport system ATP-binding protein
MIEVAKLSKEYVRGRPALSDVSFTTRAGEVLGLLGENGAGKTTLLRILAGVLFPTSGTARLHGHDVVRSARKARAEVGYLPEQVPLDLELRVGEYLRLRAELKGVPLPQKAVAAVLDEVGLGSPGDGRRLIGELSKGLRQRVGLADAILHRPKVLLLDEPTDGLDPNQRRETLQLIRRLGETQTVLLSTHVLPEVESICHRVVVLDRGRVAAVGTPAELVLGLAAPRLRGRIELACRGDEALFDKALRELPVVATVERTATAGPVHTFRVELAPDAPESAVEIVARAALSVGELRSLQPAPSDLAAAFRFLTRPAS